VSSDFIDLDTQAHSDQAEAIACSADGAHTINNELTIKQ
jgi:osmotically-inducible protein OsmY